MTRARRDTPGPLRRLRGAALALVAVVGAGTALTACSSDSAELGETRAVTHVRGSTEVPVKLDKVVVFDLAALDTIEHLGDAGRVVGIPAGSPLPRSLGGFSDRTNVGSLKEPDFEKVAGLDPDLIIIGSRQSDKYDEFSRIAPTIDLSLNYTDLVASNRAHIATLGEVFGKQERATAALAEIDQKVEAARTVGRQAGPGLIVMTNAGAVTAYGANSRFGMIHQLLGVPTAGNVSDADKHGQAVSFEFIRDAAPAHLFVVDRDAAIGSAGANARATLDNELVRQTPAGRNGKIHYLQSGEWYIVGGGVQTLGRMIDAVREAVS